MLKTCKSCLNQLSVTSFHSHKGRKDGLNDICKDCKRIKAAEYLEKNKEKETIRKRIWADKNRARLREKRQKYRKYRRKTDIRYRLVDNMRARLVLAIKASKSNKSNGTMKLVGCGAHTLKSYLEQRFTQGMTWDNYGKWHVDHIRPCASFDLTDPEQQKQCFHYTNLQPLWAKDNLKKGAKIQDSVI